ncbi:MAG: hypothetical protein AAB425_01510 [Bdellovibrionota bacterium]
MKIAVSEDHELVRLSKAIDWDVLVDRATEIREEKVLLPSGPEPHYRELLGAVALLFIFL